jgi:alpha-L-rhamnosidase
MVLRFFLKGLTVSLLLISFSVLAKAQMKAKVSNLTCEYLTNPLGIDRPRPLLGWQINSVRKATLQTYYHIIVASSMEMLNRNIGDVWDSGKTASSSSQNVSYRGPILVPAKHYFWKVRIWDNSNRSSGWSPMAWWSTGPGVDGWKGKWISNKLKPVSSKRVYMDTWAKSHDFDAADSAALYLRKVFRVSSGIKRATAFISGLGYYELSFNGKKIGNRVLDPVFTDYQKQVNYVAYDVTRNLKTGQNALGVILGNGFYNSPSADLFQMENANWKTPPKLLVDLHIEYANGEKSVISSDGTWKWQNGEIVYNSIRGGETIDHRAHLKDWDMPSYDDKNWQQAVQVQAPLGALKAQYMPPMKVTETIRPESVRELATGTYLIDFGKNITGWISLKLKGKNGQIVNCWYNEILQKDGSLAKDNSASHTRGRFQKEVFILNGEGAESFEPRFTYHGFRYVQLEGLDKAPSIDEIKAKSVYTSLDTIGSFSCSDPRLNNLQRAVQRTLLNSMHGMPAEEPTREKMGWTLDAQVTMESYLYNFGAINAYKKNLQDYIDAQEPNGHIASIVPTNGWAYLSPEGKPIYFDDPWWGGTIFYITDKLYEQTGDTAIISHAYNAMKGYVDFVSTTAQNGLINWSLGDWLDMEHNGNGPGLTPVVQTSTAGYYWMNDKLSEFAKVIGKPDISAQYRKKAENIKKQFNSTFLDRQTGWYKINSQTAQALPLQLGIVPEDMRHKVMECLMQAISKNNDHVNAGFIGVIPLLNELSSADMEKTYKMVTQEDSPGWLHMVKDEKSTLGENLNSKGYGTGHHPYGAHIGFWLYKYLGGIRPDTAHPGFKRFIIAPQFIPELNWITSNTQSLYGKISSSWKRTADGIDLSVSIPGNSTAELRLPVSAIDKVTLDGKKVTETPAIRVLTEHNGSATLMLGSGDYHFLIRK